MRVLKRNSKKNESFLFKDNYTRKSYKRNYESKGSDGLEFRFDDLIDVMLQAKEAGDFDRDDIELYFDNRGNLTDAGYNYANDIFQSDLEEAIDQIESKFGYD